jgi:hypothetical protein
MFANPKFANYLILHYMKVIRFLILIILCTSFAPILRVKSTVKNFAEVKKVTKEYSFYQSIESKNFNLPNFETFSIAFKGFENLQAKSKIQNNLLTIIDFSISSAKNRLWIINMDTREILVNTLVAHGENTGLEYAEHFSNKNESHQSSLGFYLTGETYFGSHGMSLKLDGMEKGINDNARKRAIVVHGADYVSQAFVSSNNRLGRSFGCPAIPVNQTKKIIQIIKNKSCLFIYYPSKEYLKNSKLIPKSFEQEMI